MFKKRIQLITVFFNQLEETVVGGQRMRLCEKSVQRVLVEAKDSMSFRSGGSCANTQNVILFGVLNRL